jgi:hypothetical protein
MCQVSADYPNPSSGTRISEFQDEDVGESGLPESKQWNSYQRVPGRRRGGKRITQVINWENPSNRQHFQVLAMGNPDGPTWRLTEKAKEDQTL